MERVLEFAHPRRDWWAVLVIDSTAIGPGKGGIRLLPDVSREEVEGLARAMTLKNAMAGLPFGGAKSGIRARREERTEAVRWFARMLRQTLGGPENVKHLYIAGPDMNTTQREMAIYADEMGDPDTVTGKPSVLGGLPHELGSTGYGVAWATKTALEKMGEGIEGKTVAIEGFGNVGSFTFKFLTEMGAKVVAVSDSKGMVYEEKGLDYGTLAEVKRSSGRVDAYPSGSKGSPTNLFSLDVDVLIPGARPNAINEANWQEVKARLIVEAANIPIKKEVEEKLHRAGKVIVPDFVANAGGVISSYVEWRHGTPEEMFSEVRRRVVENTSLVISRSLEEKRNPREVAEEIALARVKEAEDYRW